MIIFYNLRIYKIKYEVGTINKPNYINKRICNSCSNFVNKRLINK